MQITFYRAIKLNCAIFSDTILIVFQFVKQMSPAEYLKMKKVQNCIRTIFR